LGAHAGRRGTQYPASGPRCGRRAHSLLLERGSAASVRSAGIPQRGRGNERESRPRPHRGSVFRVRLRRLAAGQARHRGRRLEEEGRGAKPPVNAEARPNPVRSRAAIPAAILVAVLLPLLLLPLAAVFAFAFRGGVSAFVSALKAPEAIFALRFSLLIAF